MKLNKIVGVFLLVLLVLFVSACSRQAETAASQQASSGAEEVSSSLNDAMDSVETELGEMDKLAQDLSTDDLDVLDAELSEVETAELS